MTKYGYNTITVVVVLSIVLIILGMMWDHQVFRIVSISLAVLMLVFTFNFFRDPERKTPEGEDIIVSPADGKIILIKTVEENKYLKSRGTQVSVFMSPLNVHVNRIPIDGTVEFIEYVRGEYIAAFEDKASERNERSELGILSKYGKVFFTQVAGFVARRIVYDLKIDQKVKMGERFGMIKFGSRVDVIVPDGWKVTVKNGEIVKAGETILFQRNAE